jgi:hypothetical protein
MAPIAATTSTGGPDYRNLLVGGFLQMAEAVTFGMPLEVWKTRQGAYPTESAATSFRAVYASGGVGAFWRGVNAKLIEAFTKGAVLIFAKQYLLDLCALFGMNRSAASTGAIAGAGGGIAQTVVMSPLTYVVTYNLKKPEEAKKLGMVNILKNAGLRGCYSSAPAMAMRQGSNWALRQGFNDLLVNQYRGIKKAELTVTEKVLCGLVGGAMACINQPVEVLRIRMQAEHVSGDKTANTRQVARMVMAESGPLGFFAGIIPRIGLAAYQTLFMVTFADMVSNKMRKQA